MTGKPLGWIGIVRLGLVQSALGAIVVLATSTLNRVMVVELALPAVVPGALIALHYAVQSLRPRMGHGSDTGGRHTPWIIGGMVVLAAGGISASIAIAWMTTNLIAGLVLCACAFLAIGAGVSATGTTLLVLLAKRTVESQRAGSATIVWLMMIAGFALTATFAGQALEPYSPARLIAVTTVVAAGAVLLTIAAVFGLEGASAPMNLVASSTKETAPRPSFVDALRQVWSEPQARLFTVFVFVSMLAYSGQELILEPFAGAIFAYTPGQSTKLSGLQHMGVFAGMLLVGIAGSAFAGKRLGSLRAWAIGGCLASALVLMGLCAIGISGQAAQLRGCVFLLGLANGAFAIAAIGSMMNLAGQGHSSREGVRMGLWGAAQGIAFGLGGFLGAAASDLAKLLLGQPAPAYALVFALEALLFVYSAWLASRIHAPRPQTRADMKRGAAFRAKPAAIATASAASG